MKKAIFLLTKVLLFWFYSAAQEVGYKTTDIGAEFNHYSGGNIYNLHLAFNSKLHHSFIIRAGYNAVNESFSSNYQNEKGGGLMAGLGYRYYFSYKPARFFIGLAADYWKLDVDWDTELTGGNFKYSSFIPSAEAGYMLLINDMFFITPSIKAGIKSTIPGNSSGFTAQFGLSSGIKF